MLLTSLTLAALLGAGDATKILASIEAPTLEVGQSYDIELTVQFPESVVASEAGVPAPFLQIDVPPSVKLGGRELTTMRELANNEFVHEPYERLLTDGPVSSIPFELIAEPKEGEAIGLNIVAYVSSEGSEPSFLRRRLELPVRGGAKAVESTERKSDWGIDADLLQIGDTVEPFILPGIDGLSIDTGEWLGKKKVILTTYRAHW